MCYFELLCYVGLANTHYTRTKAHAHAPVIKVITKHNSRCSRFTARCYAERGYATLSRPPVRPCATFRYRDHIGWNASKIISRLISLRFVPGFAKWKRQKQIRMYLLWTLLHMRRTDAECALTPYDSAFMREMTSWPLS